MGWVGEQMRKIFGLRVVIFKHLWIVLENDVTFCIVYPSHRGSGELTTLSDFSLYVQDAHQ